MTTNRRLFLYEPKRGKKGGWLSRHEGEEDGYTVRPATAKDLTPDRVAEFLDQEAESANNHQFVGTHVALLKAMRNEGFEVTRCRDLFLRLLSVDGLPGLR